MKKVVVTGGAGFIGRELVKKLLQKNYSVKVLDNLSKPESSVPKDVEFIKVDLTDKLATKKAFKGTDICLNLAAKIGGVGYWNSYPAMILSDNNDIYSSTFSAAVANNIERMVYISSSMVFESATQFPSKEEDIQKIPPPITSYGFSKLIGEQYCKAFWDQHQLPYSICRPFNAYGINEYPGEEVGYAHVIPDLIKKIHDGQYPLEFLGNGKEIRCFTHVSDLTDGIIAVMESKKGINNDFNVADKRPLEMVELAELLWKLMKKDKPFKVSFKKRFNVDIQKRIPDTEKIEKLIGWKPKITFEDGLKEVVDWLTKELA